MDAKTELFALLTAYPEGVKRLENAALDNNIHGYSPWSCIYGQVLNNQPGGDFRLWDLKAEITGHDGWTELEDFAIGFYGNDTKREALLGWIGEWRETQAVLSE